MATPSVYFETLGCAKNEVDTRDMIELLTEAGFLIADSIEEADAVIVNTCSFIRPAIEESLDAIFDITHADYIRDADIPVIVAGCMPSRFGSALADELTEASAFVACEDERDIVRVVTDCLGLSKEGDKAKRSLRGEGCLNRTANIAKANGFAYQNGHAYVKISDGCDRFCSYCTIPYIRGRYHSFSKDQITIDAQKAIDEGARELVLIGQDTGLWGSDLDDASNLATLLGHLAESFPSTWIRVMYTQPENVSPELLHTMACHANVAPYLDVPMQHVSSRILDSMNRSGSKSAFLDLVSGIRKAIPDAAIRTTLIAGFPGETEADFEELVSFVEEAELDYVGVFPFSREEGTKAYSLIDQLDEDEKAYRAERLRTVADAVSSAVIAKRTGRSYPVLVEGLEEDGQIFGRTIIQAPEVDGITFLDTGKPLQITQCTIEDTLMYDMEAVAE